MSSKFSQRGGVQPTPKICKAVNDSFRFVQTPIGHEVQWSTQGALGGTFNNWEINGAGLMMQVGNPIFQWRGTIGDLAGDNAHVRLFYDDIARILTIHYFAFQRKETLFANIKILVNVDANKPLATPNIRFTRDSDPGTIYAQFLF